MIQAPRKLALLLLFIGLHTVVQAEYKPQVIPEATLEDTRRATSGSRTRVEPLPQAKKLVDTPTLEMLIIFDVVQQHQECYLGAEALKAKKKELLDFEWSDEQRRKVKTIQSPNYRQELLRSTEFGGLKLEIASTLSTSNMKVLNKAVDLSNDEVGLDFVLAWVKPALDAHIDKSCGRRPAEAVMDGWRGMFLWERLARKFGLN